jgi:predicted glycogen debranching enzyme
MVSRASQKVDLAAEWLEADGLGGFASGTVCGMRTRRYHALLLSAARPPTGRLVLVNGFDAQVQTPRGGFALSSQRYTPDAVSPDGAGRIEAFGMHPWPTWHFRLEDGVRVQQEVFAVHGAAATVVRFRLVDPVPGIRLAVRFFLSGRDYHALHHENSAFGFDPKIDRGSIRFTPYPDIPEVILISNGAYRHDPHWYRHFLYTEERARGLDYVEDLAAPGVLDFDLSAGPAVVIISSTLGDAGALEGTAADCCQRLVEREQKRRSAFATELHRSADSYLVRRGTGSTVIAGYPWFTDWGRDTFISLRGLCMATGRLADAEDILLQWAAEVDGGMLPNFFPDAQRPPEYNSVDASLWFIIDVHELLSRRKNEGKAIEAGNERLLWAAVERILSGYAAGTRYHIQADPDDALLRAGEPGVQLTWMDAKVGDQVVTPRSGKPVEVQALWINALAIGGSRSEKWKLLYSRASASFARRFWNGERGCLFDVVDVDHHPGSVDASVRPNQVFAVGGLPLALLSGERARQVVDCCESVLFTRNGLRSLSRIEAGYRGRYEGDPRARDTAYHQGTAWPWLLGAFVEAWVRVRGQTNEAKAEAYRRFVAPLEEALWTTGGIGHVSEIADGEEPHTLRGCPFQAWSLGELLRLKLEALKTPESTGVTEGPDS